MMEFHLFRSLLNGFRPSNASGEIPTCETFASGQSHLRGRDHFLNPVKGVSSKDWFQSCRGFS